MEEVKTASCKTAEQSRVRLIFLDNNGQYSVYFLYLCYTAAWDVWHHQEMQYVVFMLWLSGHFQECALKV